MEDVGALVALLPSLSAALLLEPLVVAGADGGLFSAMAST